MKKTTPSPSGQAYYHSLKIPGALPRPARCHSQRPIAKRRPLARHPQPGESLQSIAWHRHPRLRHALVRRLHRRPPGKRHLCRLPNTRTGTTKNHLKNHSPLHLGPTFRTNSTNRQTATQMVLFGWRPTATTRMDPGPAQCCTQLGRNTKRHRNRRRLRQRIPPPRTPDRTPQSARHTQPRCLYRHLLPLIQSSPSHRLHHPTSRSKTTLHQRQTNL